MTMSAAHWIFPSGSHSYSHYVSILLLVVRILLALFSAWTFRDVRKRLSLAAFLAALAGGFCISALLGPTFLHNGGDGGSSGDSSGGDGLGATALAFLTLAAAAMSDNTKVERTGASQAIMPDNIEEERTGRLHPSAGIFRDFLLGEIGVENKKLQEDVARLKPLLDHMQTMEIVVGVTNDTCIENGREGRGDGSFPSTSSAPAKTEVVATAQLGRGKITGSDILVPIQSTHELLLKDTVRFGGPGGIEALLAGKSMGMFPPKVRLSVEELANKAVSVLVEDDAVGIILSISNQACIVGEVTGLTNKELARFKENPTNTFMGYMTSCSSGFPGNGNENNDRMGTTFKLIYLGFKVTDALEHTLQLIPRAIACEAGPMPMSASDELRHLALEALGGSNHRNTLRLNQLLKSKKDALLGIRKEAMRVDIEHSTGALRFSLDETEAIADKDGNTVHKYMVPDGKVGSSMTVADIKRSSFLLSGVKLNLGNLLLQMGRVDISDIVTFREGVICLRIPYASGIEVRGDLNWGEMTQRLDFNDPRLLESFRFFFAGAIVFPETIKFNVTEIRFSQESIEHIRSLAGLDDETLANVDDESKA